MSDTPRRIIVGVLPSGGATALVRAGEVDPVREMIAAAGAELDRQRAAEAKALAAKAADAARLTNTRRARAARRLKRVIRMVLR